MRRQLFCLNPPASYSPQLAAGVASIDEWFVPVKDRSSPKLAAESFKYPALQSPILLLIYARDFQANGPGAERSRRRVLPGNKEIHGQAGHRNMNKNAVLKIALLLALILVCIFLFFHYDLYRFFVSRKKIIHFINSFGPLSVVIFIGLQIVQVLVAPIPGELNGFIGGYLYGPILGTLYSMIGLTIGSWLAFLLARWLGMPFVEKIITPQIIQKYDHFMEHRGIPITLILFLIPGFPKDALSYIIGLSHMRSTTFLILCAAGRLLGTIMLSISGSCARNDQNEAMLAILGISALITLLAWYYHEEILHHVRGHKRHKGKE
jgi:uncharacterized membrane protein YdjX (TVP38/TMEM64 family)